MGHHVKILMVLATLGLTFADVHYYVPKITAKQLLGRVSHYGFILEKPQCIFNQYPSNEVWLVVANNSVVPNLKYTDFTSRSEFKDFQQNQFYHIHRTLGADYPCTDTYGNAADLLYVGYETNCSGVTHCNGPLTSLGPYRVKFVVLDTTDLTKASRWSELIMLHTGDKPAEPGFRRSAGMIVIVVILSILLAILLACLIVALITGSKDICWRRTLDNKPLIDLEMIRTFYGYKTHSIYILHTEHKLK